MTDAQTITHALGGHWYGKYGLAYCPAHDNTRTPALTLADGNAGKLLANCKAGCTFSEVLAALQNKGLVKGGGAYAAPDPLQHIRRQAEQKAETEKRSAQAFRLWQSSKPIAGTVAETYLRGRGITCDLPDTLRYAANCWHATARRFPAMVGLVEGGTGFAVHRTYLRADGTGKAETVTAKAMLGATAGGAVALSQGQGPLVVAEGLETALSLASGLLCGPATIWAALSTSGLRRLVLPPAPARLIIAPDGDKPGREAAHSLANRAHALGWQISMLPAPEGADWNDVLTGKTVLK
jgi:Toprim domain